MRNCPRCGGTGKTYIPQLCECGHDRTEHLAGFGCMACAGYYSDECLRFKADREQDASDKRIRAQELAAQTLDADTKT